MHSVQGLHDFFSLKFYLILLVKADQLFLLLIRILITSRSDLTCSLDNLVAICVAVIHSISRNQCYQTTNG